MAHCISIHAPLAGCDGVKLSKEDAKHISIHAPLAGCDTKPVEITYTFFISIHAPLAGCDPRRRWLRICSSNFNPRTPCGVRHYQQQSAAASNKFQSTHPLRGATKRRWMGKQRRKISIHAPLAGCDSKSAQKNAALLRKRYKYKLFVCKKCTSGGLTGTYSSKKYALFRCELLGKSVRAFGSHS